MEYSEIRSRIESNLGSEFIAANTITPELIESVIEDYANQLAFETDAIRNNFNITTDGSIYYYLGDEAIFIHRVLYDWKSDSQYGYEVQEVGPNYVPTDDEKGAHRNYAEGDKLVYWLEQAHTAGKAKIYFDPIPPAGKIIRIMASKYPTILASSNDTVLIEFKKVFKLALIQGCTMELGAIGKGIPTLNYFIGSYEKNKQHIKDLLWQQSKNRTVQIPYRESWQ